MKKNSILLCLFGLFVSSCEKDSFVFPPVEDGALFYYQGSSGLFRDHQFVYPYLDRAFVDPEINHSIFPVNTFSLKDSLHLGVELVRATTYESQEKEYSWIIARKIPISYYEYGSYNKDTKSRFSGLLRCVDPIHDSSTFLLALNHETNLAVIYFLYKDLRIEHPYTLGTDIVGSPQIEIEGIVVSDLIGKETWIFSGNPYSEYEDIHPKKSLHWEIRYVNDIVDKRKNALIYIDNKR